MIFHMFYKRIFSWLVLPTTLLIIGALAYAYPLMAQSSKSPGRITWGEEIKEPAGTRIINVVDFGKHGFYALRQRSEGPLNRAQTYIETYDGKNRLTKSRKLALTYKGKDLDFEDLVMFNKQLYLLTSFNNEAKKMNYLFYQKVDKNRLIPEREMHYLAEIETKNIVEEGLFDVVISEDSTHLLIYNELPYRKNAPEEFAFRVYDNDFQLQWQKDIVLPYSDEQFVIEEYKVDDQGNVFLLGVLFKDKVRVRRQGLPNYQYIILAYTQQGEKIDEYQIDLKDKFITDLTFKINREGELVCSGFYSDRGTYSVKGTYFFKIDAATKVVSNTNMKPFDFEFLTDYMGNNEKRRAERAEASGNTNKTPELYRYSLDELILRTDGGALLIAEQYFVEQVNYSDWDPFLRRYVYSPGRFTYYYNYNDIIIVNIRPSGEIEWTARIPKRQVTVNDGGYYSSYARAIVRDRIFFIYNDNARNFDPKNRNQRLYNFNGSNSIITLAEVRKDGSVFSYPLFNNRDAGIITRPKICKQIGSKRMMVYGERNNSYRFADLTFILE